jgi:hypothetical protein
MHLPRSLAAPAALLLAATMPQLAQAREIVGFSDAYSIGTVVVKTSERALYYVLGNGQAVPLSGRCRPSRQAMDWHGLHQRQATAPGVVTARRSQARQTLAAECDSRRKPG